MRELKTDVLVVGGGLGGVAAALAALRAGRTVVLTEEYDWIGGQLTSQAVPPDEHPWVEQFGVTRELPRAARRHPRLLPDALPAAPRRPRAWRELNPGAGGVSRLCHEPRVARGGARGDARALPRRRPASTVLQPYRPVAADDRRRPGPRGHRARTATPATRSRSTPPYVLDATETGDLLPLTGTEYVTGFECAGRHRRAERAAPRPSRANMQAVSVCFAVDHVDGDHTIDRPTQLRLLARLPAALLGRAAAGLRGAAPAHPGDHASAPSRPTRTTTRCSSTPTSVKRRGDANLWTFRRIAARRNFAPGAYASDISLVNWPMIDYFEGPVIDVPETRGAAPAAAARELSLSVCTGCRPRRRAPDGGTGFPGLRLRGDVTGTADGLAMAPYIRESRRIRAGTPSSSRTCRIAVRGDKGAVRYPDSVGVGMYRIDLHPSTGGDNYIDVPLVPVRDPARRADAAPRREPAAGRQEHRHHPHHQRLLPAAPGRVEHRRGRRGARRVSAWTTPRRRTAVQADDRAARRLPGPCCRATASRLRWPDVARLLNSNASQNRRGDPDHARIEDLAAAAPRRRPRPAAGGWRRRRGRARGPVRCA